MKFWGLLNRVATVAHTTAQKFLIGSFAKLEIFHWLRCCHQYINKYAFALRYPMSISHFMHESSNIQYQGYSTMGKMTAQNEMHAGSGIL